MVKKKVLVALSGGVDSSVSAALLQEEGYDVEGAFIVTWTAPWLPCTWREERRDAMRVAAHLRIPFRTIDLSKEYERDVVDYLVAEYAAGRTPNPDVMCNKYIKFGGLFNWAMDAGFDFVATGHYARVAHEKRGSETIHQLLAGKDTNKDQTYFLWTLTQHHLAHTLFPVGEHEKPRVREFARAFGLPTAQKKDSQGVCFLGKIDMKEFLQHYIPSKKGAVLDTHGNRIGIHDGATYVTLGQRHGFTVTVHQPNMPPLYVIAKDVDANTVTVAPQQSANEVAANETSQRITLTDVNWVSGHPPVGNTCEARLRYRQKLFSVVFEETTQNTAVVVATTVQPYVPSGQSLVLYNGEVCLGGGVIETP
jgi:tRNA-specific 2-thiouridylase